MNKKFLSLVLALVMVLGTFSSVFAAPAEKKETKEAPKAAETVVPKITGKKAKIQWLQDNKYVEGRKVNKDPKNNDLALDKNIQRDEVSKLLVYAIGLDQKADALKGAYKIYNDVDLSHWANGYINVGSTEPSKANNLPFLLGYPGKVFKPVNNVTYAELAKMLVTLTKTDLTKDMHDQANKEWPVKWMAWAHELGIFEDVTVADANKAVNREDAFTMIYNAMYKLKYIEKMPVNEVRGIISQIKNGEITINQGEKAKTIKLMPNTTFVLYDRRSNTDTHDVNANPHHSVYDQIVYAGAISNPSYYYGSFVRVIANDKGEATHVLELGNPAQLAIGVVGNGANSRWADVADYTIETQGNIYERDLAATVADPVLAKINYNDNGDAKSLSFQHGIYKSNPKNAKDSAQSVKNYVYVARGNKVDLKLTSKTKYYVADVAKNQLTEVNSVDEAIRILGNTAASNWFDNVYAGYNVIDGRDKRETADNAAIAGYKEATVVVFNRVQKDNNNEQLLRVKNEATSLYDVTFEDVTGAEIMGNLISYRGAFPFNFNDAKYNVVKITNNNATGIGIQLMIERDDTDKYPVVEVTDIMNSDRTIVVKDSAGHTAVLNIDTGADTFLEGQLRVGAKIQFHTLANNVKVNDVNKTNIIDIISVLPDSTKLEGVVQLVAEHNQGNQFYADNVEANDVKTAVSGTYREVVVNQYRYIYNEKSGIERTSFWLNDRDAKALVDWINANGGKTDIRYNLRDTDTHDRVVGFDVKVFYNGNWTPVANAVDTESAAQKAKAEALFNELDKLDRPTVISGYTDQAQLDELAVKLAEIAEKYKSLKTDLMDQTEATNSRDKIVRAFNWRLRALKTQDGTVDPAKALNPTMGEL